MRTTECRGNALPRALRKHVLQSPKDSVHGTHQTVYAIFTPHETFYFVEIIKVLHYKTWFGMLMYIEFEARPTMRGPQFFSWRSPISSPLFLSGWKKDASLQIEAIEVHEPGVSHGVFDSLGVRFLALRNFLWRIL